MSHPVPASESSQTLPSLDVLYEDPDTNQMMAMRVRPTLKDRAAYEIQAHKNNWPTKNPMQTATFTWFAFQAWSALRRESAAPVFLRTDSLDQFLEVVQNVEPVSEEGEETIVDPTQSEATFDSD